MELIQKMLFSLVPQGILEIPELGVGGRQPSPPVRRDGTKNKSASNLLLDLGQVT